MNDNFISKDILTVTLVFLVFSQFAIATTSLSYPFFMSSIIFYLLSIGLRLFNSEDKEQVNKAEKLADNIRRWLVWPFGFVGSAIVFNSINSWFLLVLIFCGFIWLYIEYNFWGFNIQLKNWWLKIKF